MRRKMDELAEAGMPHGGASRPFGYAEDRITIVPHEAEIIRDLAERLLAGDTLASLTRWLNDNDIPTVTGRGEWRGTTVRNLLRNPRLSGQRVHRGQIIGKAVWDPILTPEQTDRLRRLLDDPARRTTRAARRYLLAGMLRCHKCNATLMSHPRKGVGRYVCKTGADFRGCGGTQITAARVDELIVGAVLMRLDNPAVAAALADQHADNADAAALAETIAQADDKLTELSNLWAADEITTDEWKTARASIEARRDKAARQLSRTTNTTALDGLVGNGQQLRGQWNDLNLNRQRAIVQAVLDHAVIGPGSNRFDPSRVQPVWRW